MYKKLFQLVVVSLSFGGSLALAQSPPACNPCDCPDPSCYACHTSCGTLSGGLARNRRQKKPQSPKTASSELLVLASATPLAAGVLAVAGPQIVRSRRKQ